MSDIRPSDPWLPDDFQHPLRVDLATGQHLGPIRAEEDVDNDPVPRWIAEAWPLHAPRYVGRT
ncbi:hypothetical protein BH23ACT9_BH23ACT9_10840 [soil metagenome]